MKEAAGEANMTVLTIILIGIVLAVGTALIPKLMGNVEERSDCIENGGTWENGKCVGAGQY